MLRERLPLPIIGNSEIGSSSGISIASDDLGLNTIKGNANSLRNCAAKKLTAMAEGRRVLESAAVGGCSVPRAVVEAWPTLSNAIKAGIVAPVGVAAGWLSVWRDANFPLKSAKCCGFLMRRSICRV